MNRHGRIQKGEEREERIKTTKKLISFFRWASERAHREWSCLFLIIDAKASERKIRFFFFIIIDDSFDLHQISLSLSLFYPSP